MNEVTIIAFNYGNAGRYANGPGICLFNFVKSLRNAGLKVNLFTELKTKFGCTGSILDRVNISRAISRSKVLHHWSGIGEKYSSIIKLANSSGLKILIGPNVLDGVKKDKESSFLNKIKYDKIFLVNDRIKFFISRYHHIDLSKLGTFMIGPDIELWSPSKNRDNTILWKGNSKQPVKDVEFALKVQDMLPQYKFKFIGYPNPYSYMDHIQSAKRSKITINTSLSETMGLAMLESWASSVPSVSHPKIYMHGINYRTGIITNKTAKDYCEAIVELMEDNNLYNFVAEYSRDFIIKELNNDLIAKKYIKNYIGA